MEKKIEFKARNKFEFDTFLKPYPATKSIPDWWKNATPYTDLEHSNGGKKMFLIDGVPTATFKKCTPMLDALGSGYIIPLFTDVHVAIRGNQVDIGWKTVSDVFQQHGNSSRDIEPPAGYTNEVFKYLNTWIPITPPGYSVLVTSPFGYKNLPFHAIPAIIDSDKSLLEVVPPMWLKEGFQGVIENGTPLLQITPFKRENWKSVFSYYENHDFAVSQEVNFNSTIVGHYIKKVWSKKTYR